VNSFRQVTIPFNCDKTEKRRKLSIVEFCSFFGDVFRHNSFRSRNKAVNTVADKTDKLITSKWIRNTRKKSYSTKSIRWFDLRASNRRSLSTTPTWTLPASASTASSSSALTRATWKEWWKEGSWRSTSRRSTSQGRTRPWGPACPATRWPRSLAALLSSSRSTNTTMMSMNQELDRM